MKNLSDFINESIALNNINVELFLDNYCNHFKLDRDQWWFQKGKKYFKILKRQGANGKYMDDKYSITEMFIDAEGNIYKPASHSKPANGIRGNIYDKDVFDTAFDNFGFVVCYG